MIASPQDSYLTPEQYLQMEDDSSIKHEYINGEIYAIAGATDIHVTIALNTAILLCNYLRGSGCRVYISDMKAKIKSRNCYYYPDIMVTCEAKDRENATYKKYPLIIIEVLSDSTEAFDRGDKFIDYQYLETLQEYVLINSKKARIECFLRTEDNLWTWKFYSENNKNFELTSINFVGAMDEVYEEVNFPK